MATEAFQPGEPNLEVVIANYLRASESGHRLDPEQLLARHPHIAAELREFFANHARMEQWAYSAQSTPPARPEPCKGQVLGPYELLGEIARGGMGIVHRARQLVTGRLVALKRMRVELASPAEMERFRSEAEAASNLDHPNIVTIYEVGEHHGQPYFSMKLIEGGNLAARMKDIRLPLLNSRTGRDVDGKAWSRAEIEECKARIARLLATVARAVHHAHQHRILHRDLKPANILLDARPQAPEAIPHVTDFGLAKQMASPDGESAEARLTLPGMIVGTPSYMAPEQAACAKVLTTAVDVWSLGAIFYELLTGRTPFVGRTTQEILRQLQESEPEPPRSLNPLVDRDLEAICLKCLEKEPSARYGSAEMLADHLGLWLEGKPVPVRRPGTVERCLRWCLRHPAAAVLSVAAGALLIAVVLTSVSLAQAREARLREEVLNLNRDMAGHAASSVLLQLEHLSRPVVQTAEHPRLRECLERGEGAELQKLLAAIHKQYEDPRRGFRPPGEEPTFISWYVLDLDGKILAVSPPNPKVVGVSFAGRDYFQGALRHRNQKGQSAIHISRIFRSVNDGYHKFGISAPVHNKEGTAIGVVAATIPSATTMGSLRLNNDRRIAVLVGPQDTNPQEKPADGQTPGKHLILLHPAYRRPGEVAVEISSSRLAKLQGRQRNPGEELGLPGPDAAGEADDQYFDPVAGAVDASYSGRWLAGFAPVGHTEFVVIVQQRYDDAIGPDQRLTRDLILRAGIAVALGVLLVGALVRSGVRRVLGRRQVVTSP